MAYPIVDLKRSEWDKKKSDPKMGEYHFTTKVYYKNRDFKEGYIHPYKIKWCKYSELDYPRPYATLHKWKLQFKAEVLTVGDDYWPEGHVPDAEGKYVNGDLICVKIPFAVHMQARKEAVRKSELEADGVKQKFKAKMVQTGSDIPDEWMQEKEERMRNERRSERI